MFERLSRLFGRTRTREPFHDPVLGTLTPTAEEPCYWNVDLMLSGRSVSFEIAGQDVPSLTSLQHAHDIVREWDNFERRVGAFLEREAQQQTLPAAAQEIRGLRVEAITLFLPNVRNDGMIWFAGGCDDRGWRCDYANREPRQLGFDR